MTRDFIESRNDLRNALVEWRDSGAPVDDVIVCLEDFIRKCAVDEIGDLNGNP